MKTSLIRTLLGLAVTLWSISSPAQTLSIGSEWIGPGGTATAALEISGLTAQKLGAFDVDVGFDPAILSLAMASFGDPLLGDQLNLEGFGTISGLTPGTGTVDLFELSLDAPDVLAASQSSSFTLATLTFNAIGSGTSDLLLSINALGARTASRWASTWGMAQSA